MAEPDLTFTIQAYFKMVLHAAKYPHSLINGVLIADKGNTKQRKIVDCVPLFHIHPQLSPMLEVALTQIEGYCKRHNYTMYGYYQANELASNPTLNPLATKIASKIRENNENEGILVMLNYSAIEPIDFDKNEMIDVYTCSNGQDWKKKNENRSGWIEKEKDKVKLSTIFNSLIDLNATKWLIDFDNHLDNCELNWKNTIINDNLKALVKHNFTKYLDTR
ncbi:DgyrCDS4155 [Dimorphilus gyrociliatus]|uniref:DgyrCDS4155 n=1 Tax=Dimorphilus gyrociliatus TaxID=2664684 RepID=A0A7I8VIQ8_9ANNE|nr:DgyrCDS4155 [Dimorphilus gyrociliatus]